jgi:hypothetical protein
MLLDLFVSSWMRNQPLFSARITDRENPKSRDIFLQKEQLDTLFDFALLDLNLQRGRSHEPSFLRVWRRGWRVGKTFQKKKMKTMTEN